MTRKIIKEGISRKDLAEILFSRLEHRFPDIVSQYGHERVGEAILDVADMHQGVEELGTSDISIMLKQVMDELQMINEDQNEIVSYGLYTADKDEPLMKFNDTQSLKDAYVKLTKKYPGREFIAKKTTTSTMKIGHPMFLEDMDSDVEIYKDRLNKIRSTLRGKEYGMAYDQLLKDMPDAHNEYVRRQNAELWSKEKGFNRGPGNRSGVDESKPGLWANIHAKRERIKKGSGERMRKPGSKGAPSAQDFKDAAKTSTKESAIMKGLQSENKKS